MKLFGHVVRKEVLENLVVTGIIEGRQRDTYLTYQFQRNYLTPMELIHYAHEIDVRFEFSKLQPTLE